MLKKTKLVFVVAALALLCINVSAFTSDIPSEIKFHEVPKDLSFTVTNTEGTDRELSVTPVFPVEHLFLENPGTVLANETKTVKIRFFPRKDLLGTQFTGTLKVSMGISNAEKNIKMEFLPQNACPVSIDTAIEVKENGFEKIFVLNSKLFNHKQENVVISLSEVQGLPKNWKTEAVEGVRLGSMQNGLYMVTLFPGENFDGEVSLVFNCDGFKENRAARISFDGQKDFFSGFAGLFSFDFFSGGFLLNAFLVLLAAVLLIAFISRLVRKLHSSAPAMATENGNGFESDEISLGAQSDFGGKVSKNLEDLKKEISGGKK